MIWFLFSYLLGDHPIYLTILAFFLIAFPHLYSQQEESRRQRTISQELPTLLDSLALSVNAGLNLEQALRNYQENYSGVLSQEIFIYLQEVHLGRSHSVALKTLSKRINTDEFSTFITYLLYSQKLGVSLSQTLQIQSNLLRTHHRQQIEEASHTASVKMAIPLVFCIFPALLIIYLAPAILRFYYGGI